MMGAMFVFLDLEVHITGSSNTSMYYSQRAVCRVLILFCIRGRRWTVRFTYFRGVVQFGSPRQKVGFAL
jgi:hypothetical protein